MIINQFVRIKSAILSADKRGKKTHTVSRRRTQTLLPGNPRMKAGRWAECRAVEFQRMSSMLEAGVLPEVRGQDSPASGPGSLHSSLCCGRARILISCYLAPSTPQMKYRRLIRCSPSLTFFFPRCWCEAFRWQAC